MDPLSTNPVQRARSPGRLLAFLGIVVAFLGLAGYAAQIYGFKVLIAPWYLPVLGSLGVCLMVAALARRRTLWRFLGLGLLGLLAGMEWMVLLSLSRLPAYSGRVAVGKPFPEFTTRLADGTTFSRKDLEGGQSTVMVFFRGRW